MDCRADGCWGNALPRDDLCLVHAPDRGKRFLQRLANDRGGADGRFRGLDIPPAIFTELCSVIGELDEHVDFSGAVFPSGSDFGQVRFNQRAIFNGARFAGDVRFAGVTFGAEARFNGSIFAGPASFGAGVASYFSGIFYDPPEGATFEGTAEFIGAQFHDDAQFDLVRFQRNVDFTRARFYSEFRLEDLGEVEPMPTRRISFHNTRFGGGVIANLPDGRVEAAGMEIGGPSRLIVRGPVSLDRITLNHPLTILTTSREEVRDLSAAGSSPELISLTGATLQAPLIVGAGVSLERCQLSGAVGLERLGLHAGTSPLALYRGRRVIYDEIRYREDAGRHHPASIAGRYRQLRQGLEDAKNAPGAADFYFGEMEMRRAASTSRYERFFLWLYWLVSGYGLRAWRSAAAYVAVVLAATAAFRYGDLRVACPAGSPCADLDDWWSSLVFVVRWSVSLFPSPDTAGISTGGQAVLLALRFVSPVLIALTFLSIRSRVHR